MQRLFRWLKFNLMYFRRPPWDTGISPPELLSHLQNHPPGRALDLGCGTGTNMLTLAQAGWQVTGVDFARRAVNQARHRLRAAGYPAHVYLEDVSRLESIVGPFNLVLDIGCYHGLPESSRSGYRQNLLRVMAPESRFLLYAHMTENENAAMGLHRRDINAFEARLACLHRQESLDRWGRAAVWMTFGPLIPNGGAS